MGSTRSPSTLVGAELLARAAPQVARGKPLSLGAPRGAGARRLVLERRYGAAVSPRPVLSRWHLWGAGVHGLTDPTSAARAEPRNDRADRKVFSSRGLVN